MLEVRGGGGGRAEEGLDGLLVAGEVLGGGGLLGMLDLAAVLTGGGGGVRRDGLGLGSDLDA